jgi:hypothetical protein
MLELARVLTANGALGRTVVFVAFTGEESGRTGSRHYVRNSGKFPVEKIMGMVNLDTVGRLEDGKLLVLNGSSAAEWIHIFRGAGYVSGVDIQVVNKELDASDQVSFIEAGIPAVQLFAGLHLDYHKPEDTADRIDPEGLVKVVAVAKEAVEYLAAREEPLTAGFRSPSRKGKEESIKGERKVSLGTIPDFAFEEEGVKLDGTMPGSPAEEAGLEKGDVITGMNGRSVKELRDLSDILKSLEAGDTVLIRAVRGVETVEFEAVLEGR